MGWVVGPELSVVSPRFEHMDDITGSMDVTGLDAPGALAVAVASRRAADRAEAQLLGLAAHWADLHAVLPADWLPPLALWSV